MPIGLLVRPTHLSITCNRDTCSAHAWRVRIYMGFNPYAYRWESTHHAAQLQEKFADLPSSEEVDMEVAIATSILLRRAFGKLAFFSLQDETGTIQLYLDKKRIGRNGRSELTDPVAQRQRLKAEAALKAAGAS